MAAVALCAETAHAQKVDDLDPHLRVTTVVSPPKLHLEWNASTDATSWVVRRREGSTFTTVATLPPGTTSYDDTAVESGRTYEYNVQRKGTTTSGAAWVLAGMEVPFPDDLGVVAVVVDNTSAKLTQVTRFQADLALEGFDVVAVSVEESDAPKAVRDKLKAVRTEHGARFRTAILLGRVPRVFSGLLNPDGHPDHRGAWPADTYYGDLDGEWPDTQDLGGEGTFINKPGDGKLDPTKLPSDLDIAVGRVDFRELPAFGALDDQKLLQRWLDANHAFRSGEKRYGARTWVTDSFGYFSGEAFSRMAFRDGSAVFGSPVETGKPFFDALEAGDGYGLAFGCGAGSPTSAAGVGTTTDFAKRKPRAAFLGLFGSYFGDWSYKDDLLRAALASEGGVMATVWFARPWHHAHHLGALRTFGEAFVVTANNSGTTYDTGAFPRSVHLALLGDPTLRLWVVRPPSDVTATQTATGVKLSWTPSPDADAINHHVYRRTSKGAFVRVSSTLVGASSFEDPLGEVTPERYTYRVVAVARKTTGSGTFFLHSPGALADVDVTPPPLTETPDDAGAPSPANASAIDESAGCGCHTPHSTSTAPFALLLLVGLLRRRR